MTYELAKELKEAGFPQTGSGLCKHDIYGSEYRESCDCSGYPDRFEPAEIASIPTLSELIEACGEEFVGLIKKGDWLAISNKTQVSGSAPEEAVARLWLTLK